MNEITFNIIDADDYRHDGHELSVTFEMKSGCLTWLVEVFGTLKAMDLKSIMIWKFPVVNSKAYYPVNKVEKPLESYISGETFFADIKVFNDTELINVD
jgi:hypothetical protein